MSKTEKLSAFNLSTLWFGAAISIAEILTGALLAPLGFKKALLAIVLGHIVGVIIMVLGGIIGFESKLPAITSTKLSFGKYGTYLFSILNVLQLIGWTAVMIISGGRSANYVSSMLWNFNNQTFWSIAIGFFVCLWIFLGDKGLKALNTTAVALLFILTILLSLVVFKDSTLFTKMVPGEMTFGAAFELSIVMPLSWLPLISDYTRFAKDKKSAVIGPFTGYFVGSTWMYIIGLAAGIVAENADPGAMMMAANLGILGLLIVILSTVTTTFLDAYSAGISFLNINENINEKTITVAMSIIGTLIALVFPIEDYENFLYAIGSVFAPLFAILITDYFILKNIKSDENKIISWVSILVWIIGVFIYYQLIKLDFIIGSTVPCMLITGIIYAVLRRITKSCAALKKTENL